MRASVLFTLMSASIESWSVGVLILVVVISGTANAVARKVALVPLEHYPFFLSQISSLVYAVIYSTILVVRIYRGKASWDMTKISKTPFIVIGVLDALGEILGNIGAAGLPGSLLPLLAKLNLPFTTLFSRIILKKKYDIRQLLGVFTVAIGSSIATFGSNKAFGSQYVNPGLVIIYIRMHYFCELF